MAPLLALRRNIRSLADSRRRARSRELHERDRRQHAAQAGRERAAHDAAVARAEALHAEAVARLTLPSMQKEALQGTFRIHDRNPLDSRRCAAPRCNEPYPCFYRRTAVAELLAAGVTPWTSR